MSSRQRAGLLLLLSAIAVAVLVRPFVSGLLGALVLTVVATPLYDRMRTRRHPRIAAAAVVAGAVLLVVAPGAALLLIAIDQLPDAVRWIEQSGIRERIAMLHVGGTHIGGRLAAMGDAALSWMSGRVVNVAGGIVQATINLVIAMFGLYYLLLRGDELWRRVRPVLPFSPNAAEGLRARFRSVTHATILGTLAIAAIQGTAAGLAFWFVGLPHPLVWGVLTAFGAVVPVIGSGLVWIPATLMLLVSGRYADALALGAIGSIIVANVDNLARPVIYRRISRIHPMITLVGAFAGVRYFGVLGVLFGPLGLAYFFEVLTLYRREYGSGEESSTPGAPAGTRGAASAGYDWGRVDRRFRRVCSVELGRAPRACPSTACWSLGHLMSCALTRTSRSARRGVARTAPPKPNRRMASGHSSVPNNLRTRARASATWMA